MTYNAKTNWKSNDPVTEDDFNRMEQGIKDAHDIAETGGTGLAEHEGKRNNPHHVNKSQVGLGSVDNVKQATKEEFDSHVTDGDIHVTKADKDKWDAHESNKSNPHNTNKTQVGLGNVENYGIATDSEAKSGNSDAKYMTPVKTKAAIDERSRGTKRDVLELKDEIKRVNLILESQEPIFGVKWDKSSDPTFERTDVAENMVANTGEINAAGIVNDFDDAPIFNDMELKWTYNGEVYDYFVKIPKFYIRKQDGPKYKSIQVSKIQYPGFYLPKVFWDFEKNKELDYFYYGAYASVVKDGILHSAKDEYPTIRTNIVDFRNYVNARSTGFQLNDIHAIDALRTLMFVEFGTLDLQSIFKGYTEGRYHESDTIKSDANAAHIIVDKSVADNFRVGQSISVGSTRGGNQRFYGRTITSFRDLEDNTTVINFSGDPVQTYAGDIVYNTAWRTNFSRLYDKVKTGYLTANDGKHPFVYRGIENPYGDIFEWVDGININDHQAWVADDARDYASNLFAHPYRKLGYTNATESGYAKEMGFDVNAPFAEFPTEIGAGSSTYYSDYYSQNPGQRVARFGGAWYNGAAAGPSSWTLSSSAASTSVRAGARLLYKPL